MQIELLLLIISVLFFFSILADKVGYKFGVPVLLLFLGVGMLFGSDGLGIQFENIQVAQTIGTVALCIILFSGGMDTKISEIRPVLAQGVVLATVGVVLMALFTGFAIWFIFGMSDEALSISLLGALLLAATMSSTDSASVFSILRSKGLNLKNNLRPMLELESGSNDPMAYVLTAALISVVNSGEDPNVWYILLKVLVQLIVGTVMGFALGKLMVWGINKLNIYNESLYPIMMLTCCIFIFSVTYFIQGNSYLAVYVGGLVIGNSKFVHKRSILHFFDGLSWLSQLMMFLTLGLLVNPSELLVIAMPALIVSVVMIFVTRPLSVIISLLPFRKMRFKDKIFVSWVGLRGAVPIIFAIMTVSANVPYSNLIFNVVFFCTLISLVIQGTSLSMMANWLKIAERPKNLKKVKNFDIDLPEEVKSVATEIVVTEDILKIGKHLMDLEMPNNTLVIMVKRGDGFFVPTGKSTLMLNDILLIITDDKETLAKEYERLKVPMN